MKKGTLGAIGIFLLWLAICAIIFALTGCSENIPSPVCDTATIEHKEGQHWCVTIKSESPSVVMCRDFGTRTSCWTIVEHYYQCIEIETSIGEVITFEDNGAECSVTVR